MKQITIYDLLPLLKKGWVAYEQGGWHFFEKKPKATSKCWEDFGIALEIFFDITPFDGNWKDSLIKVEHKEKE